MSALLMILLMMYATLVSITIMVQMTAHSVQLNAKNALTTLSASSALTDFTLLMVTVFETLV